MKEFFKYVAATVVGLIAFGIIITGLMVMSLVGMIASSQATTNVSDNSVLVIQLSGTIEEQSSENVFSKLSGSAYGAQGLNDMLAAIEKAKNNDKIKGIYLEAGAFGADYASLQEIRNALQDFRKSRKWIVAYGDSYTQGAYYLASVASKVYLNPQGMIEWRG